MDRASLTAFNLLTRLPQYWIHRSPYYPLLPKKPEGMEKSNR